MLYQFVCIIWICSFLHISNNLSILNGLKLSFKSVVFFLIFEMVFAMIYEVLFNIDFSVLDNTKAFMFMMPIRLVEILFLRRWNIMKIWFGGAVRK